GPRAGGLAGDRTGRAGTAVRERAAARQRPPPTRPRGGQVIGCLAAARAHARAWADVRRPPPGAVSPPRGTDVRFRPEAVRQQRPRGAAPPERGRRARERARARGREDRGPGRGLRPAPAAAPRGRREPRRPAARVLRARARVGEALP